MNILNAALRGINLVNNLALVAVDLKAGQKPDMSPLSGSIFAILTIDFKVKPGNATPAKGAAVLTAFADLFLPNAP
jgi:hypothetical protein